MGGFSTQIIGFWEGIAQKIDESYVTRNNLSQIYDLALHVFEAGSKTSNAKTVEKIICTPMLHGINFLHNIVALKIIVANRLV